MYVKFCANLELSIFHIVNVRSLVSSVLTPNGETMYPNGSSCDVILRGISSITKILHFIAESFLRISPFYKKVVATAFSDDIAAQWGKVSRKAFRRNPLSRISLTYFHTYNLLLVQNFDISILGGWPIPSFL